MNEPSKLPQGGGSLERFGMAIVTVVRIICGIAWTGLKQVRISSPEFMILVPSTVVLLFAITFADYAHLKVLHWLFPAVFSAKIEFILRSFSKLVHFLVMTSFSFFAGFFMIGFFPFQRRQEFQHKLNVVGLKNARGGSPRVVNVVPVNDNRTRIIVVGNGVGADRFESKRGDLESSFEQIVESISPCSNRKLVEIVVCRKELTKMLPFDEVFSQLTMPYSFIVGESANGLITQDIRDLPHLLIAGSTNGGKSFFVRQVLCCLQHSSPRLQMYLIDLKRGVELKDFKQLPNVRLAKTEMEAVHILKVLRDEMHRRFDFMEKNGVNKIDPERHNMDLIVLAIDEASVLYGKVAGKSAKAELVREARDLTDELAKLARAAGIHLIIATQKAVKDSLDTKTLENLTGRMAFKMATHAGSNTALGNVDAYSLPAIRGRGIWGGGNQFIEVQTPLLTEKDLDLELKALNERFSSKEKEFFGPMLDVQVSKARKSQVIDKVTDTGTEES